MNQNEIEQKGEWAERICCYEWRAHKSYCKEEKLKGSRHRRHTKLLVEEIWASAKKSGKVISKTNRRQQHDKSLMVHRKNSSAAKN